jgi:hypothetical protein
MLLEQVSKGIARPRVTVRDFMNALSDGTLPSEAYIFHNVSRYSRLETRLSVYFLLVQTMSKHEQPAHSLVCMLEPISQ